LVRKRKITPQNQTQIRNVVSILKQAGAEENQVDYYLYFFVIISFITLYLVQIYFF